MTESELIKHIGTLTSQIDSNKGQVELIELYRGRIRCYQYLGQKEPEDDAKMLVQLCKELIEKTTDRTPGYCGLLFNYCGWAHRVLDQYDEATALSERHIKEIPSDSKGYSAKGAALECQNKW